MFRRGTWGDPPGPWPGCGTASVSRVLGLCPRHLPMCGAQCRSHELWSHPGRSLGRPGPALPRPEFQAQEPGPGAVGRTPPLPEGEQQSPSVGHCLGLKAASCPAPQGSLTSLPRPRPLGRPGAGAGVPFDDSLSICARALGPARRQGVSGAPPCPIIRPFLPSFLPTVAPGFPPGSEAAFLPRSGLVIFSDTIFRAWASRAQAVAIRGPLQGPAAAHPAARRCHE